MALLSQTKDNNNLYISTWQHNKLIPNELLTCSIEEFELILALSSEALKSLRQSTSSIQFQEILNKKIFELNSQKQNELEKLQFEFERQKNSEQNLLQRKIQELQTNLEQSVKSYQALNQNFMNLQSSTQQNFGTYLQSSLESQKRSMDEQFSKVESIYKTQIQTLQGSLNEYTKKAITNNISSNKGKSGEQSFDSLVETFTTWELKDTSKTPQSCDRFGEIRGCKTLFEIKNYSYNIPRKEVDKFKRDLEAHSDCPLGIFISLNTMIVGAPQDFFYTEFTSSNQLLIYIQQFNNYEAETLFSILNSIIEIATLLHKKSSTIEDSTLQHKVDSVKNILQSEIINISKMITELQTHNKLVIETIQKQNSSIKHNLEKLQFTFKSIFQTLFERSDVSHSCFTTQNNMLIETSSHDERKPPKKRRVSKKKETDNAIVINVT